MQNRNDEPRLQHAPLRLPRKDDGRGRVNRRAMGVGRVSERRKVTSQKPGGNFRQPQSEAEDRAIWPCRDRGRRSSYHRRIFFEAPVINTFDVNIVSHSTHSYSRIHDLTKTRNNRAPNTAAVYQLTWQNILAL